MIAQFTIEGVPTAKGHKATDEQLVAAYQELRSVTKVGALFGMSPSSVHGRLKSYGVVPSRNAFSSADKARLIRDYDNFAGKGRLAELAHEMGRTPQYLCRQAKALGLTQYGRARADADLFPERSRKAIVDHGHPRGMAGKAHSAATASRLRATTTSNWQSLTEDERSAQTLKSMKTRVAKYGSLSGDRTRGTWKAGWRVIGGVRKYYRSRWEANYARYLQWLVGRGEILDWKHEPETFWFEAIKRGTRSYLPDFRVWENDGSSCLHEVKGWMDARSATILKRMAKYHPSEKIVLVEKRQYQSIENKLGRMIEGWEIPA